MSRHPIRYGNGDVMLPHRRSEQLPCRRIEFQTVGRTIELQLCLNEGVRCDVVDAWFVEDPCCTSHCICLLFQLIDECFSLGVFTRTNDLPARRSDAVAR